MVLKDTTFNSEPTSRPESQVISMALLRQEMIERSRDKGSNARAIMKIGHPDGVRSAADRWSRTYNHLEWMNVRSTHTEEGLQAIHRINNDGVLKLEEVINTTENEIPEDIKDRISSARERVANSFNEIYQDPNNPVAVPTSSAELQIFMDNKIGMDV